MSKLKLKRSKKVVNMPQVKIIKTKYGRKYETDALNHHTLTGTQSELQNKSPFGTLRDSQDNFE